MRSAFIISAIQSGCGKTLITIGLLAALIKRAAVQSFKVGPDFIDPGLHKVITGKTSWNLDKRMCGDEYVKHIFAQKSAQSEVSIVEGVMGLFDGADASTAETAKLLNLPVILIVDVKSMAESAASIVKGVQHLDQNVNLRGVILNRTASDRHFNLTKNAIEDKCSIDVLGSIPKDNRLVMPQRHLGLYTAFDNFINNDFTNNLSQLVESRIDIEKLLDLTAIKEKKAPAYNNASLTKRYKPLPKRKTIRIAVALDNAFCFYYDDNLELFETLGAELVFFSPIKDARLPDNVNALYLGGGYPETYACELSNNKSMRASILDFYNNNGFIYAECGGFVYLAEDITDFEGITHSFVGIFKAKAQMTHTLKLGYREITLTQDTIIGKQGDVFRGHEFHYSHILNMPDSVNSVYQNSRNAKGYALNNCLASYVHLHFASSPEKTERFINNLSRI
ncbi:cobyrinic acid a,c-diamide synthase [Candidatus Magnetoovum chiemensis]|nr:cobyrinic acid a,c-diamide synthase [Candidatus Magnetoovum chiemensis]